MKNIKDYIIEGGFSKSHLETEARIKLLDWCHEFNWDYEKVNQKVEYWYDNDYASNFFDKRRFNNQEAGQFSDYIHNIMKDESSFKNFKQMYENK